MLRISANETGKDHMILRLEGRVTGPWVNELWKACEKVIAQGQTLVLNLAEVSFLDPAAINMLSKVRSKGAKLSECSPFVTEQLKADNLM